MRISVDLTDLVRSVWTDEDLDQEFDKRLGNLKVEYREVEREMLSLDSVESQAYSIECARLAVQLREIGVTGVSEGSEDSDEEDSGEDSNDEEEECLEEKLVRKVSPGQQVDGRVYDPDRCLECEETLDECTCVDEEYARRLAE